VVNDTPQPLHLRERGPVSILQEVGWAPEYVLTDAKITPPQGFVPQTVQPLASSYTDYAIPAHWRGKTKGFATSTEVVHTATTELQRVKLQLSLSCLHSNQV
jgi:hypothetical protein